MCLEQCILYCSGGCGFIHRLLVLPRKAYGVFAPLHLSKELVKQCVEFARYFYAGEKKHDGTKFYVQDLVKDTQTHICTVSILMWSHGQRQVTHSPLCIWVGNSSSSLCDSPGKALCTVERSVTMWSSLPKILQATYTQSDTHSTCTSVIGYSHSQCVLSIVCNEYVS